MATQIDNFEIATALTGTEVVQIGQDNELKKTTTQDIADLAGGGASYLVYTAVLSQVGTGAPTVDLVYENTIGNIVWTRQAAGVYRATLLGAFPINKCMSPYNYLVHNSSTNMFGFVLSAVRTNDNIFLISTYNKTSLEPEDDLLIGATIEIRVYP